MKLHSYNYRERHGKYIHRGKRIPSQITAIITSPHTIEDLRKTTLFKSHSMYNKNIGIQAGKNKNSAIQTDLKVSEGIQTQKPDPRLAGTLIHMQLVCYSSMEEKYSINRELR